MRLLHNNLEQMYFIASIPLRFNCCLWFHNLHTARGRNYDFLCVYVAATVHWWLKFLGTTITVALF